MFAALESHKVDLPVEGPLKLEDDIFSDDAEDKALQDEVYEIEKAEMLVEIFRVTRNKQIAELLFRHNLRTSVSLETLNAMTSDTEWELATEGFFNDLKDKVSSFITKAISSIGKFITNHVGKVTDLFKKNEDNAKEFASIVVTDDAVKQDTHRVNISPAKIILDAAGKINNFILAIQAAVLIAWVTLKGISAAKSMNWREMFKEIMTNVKKKVDFTKYGCTVNMTEGVIESVPLKVSSGETFGKLGFDKATTRNIFDHIKSLSIIQSMKDCGTNIGKTLHNFGSGSTRIVAGYLRFVRNSWTIPILAIAAIIATMTIVVASYKRIARTNAQAKTTEA